MEYNNGAYDCLQELLPKMFLNTNDDCIFKTQRL